MLGCIHTNRPRSIPTETCKISTVPNAVDLSVQYEHLHTIVHKPFLIFLSIGIGLCQYEHK